MQRDPDDPASDRAVQDRAAPGRVETRRPQRVSPAARRRARWDLVAGILVTVAVVAVGAGAAAVLHDRTERARSAGPQSSASETSSAAPAVIAVVGDDLGGAHPGSAESNGTDPGSADPTWIGAAAADAHVAVVTRVAPSAGYVTAAPTIGALAASAPSSARAVVLLGGGADAGSGALELLRAETRAIAAARAAAPTARLVVVGPLAATGTGTVRSTLASAARLAGARFVDPVADHWLTPAQAGRDGEQPDATGRAILEQRLGAVLADV